MDKGSIQTRLQLALDLALDTMSDSIRIVHSMGMEETARRCDNGVLDALNLSEVAQSVISTIRQSEHADYDDCAVGLAHIGSLFRSIATAIGPRTDPLGRAALANTYLVDVFLRMIELSEET